MTPKRLDLKNQINALALEVKEARRAFKLHVQSNKENARQYNLLVKERDEVFRTDRQRHSEVCAIINKTEHVNYPRGSVQLRAMHIVASLLRGKTYNQIERKVHSHNALVDYYVSKFIKEYKDEVWFDIQKLYENKPEEAFVRKVESTVVETQTQDFKSNFFKRMLGKVSSKEARP